LSILLDKLLRQYEEHGTLIVAFDYDDTLVTDKDEYEEFCIRARKALQRCNDNDLEVIIFTCRDDEVPVMAKLSRYGLCYDYFNESPFNTEASGHGKPYYNIFIDDKAGCNEALETLEHFLDLI
tara:strand:+ start:381 stop:752 length:372 start_codon:yes stop_codon:yes gene_type:complete